MNLEKDNQQRKGRKFFQFKVNLRHSEAPKGLKNLIL